MNILVIGAGDTGEEIATRLIENRCNVTILDKSMERIIQLQNTQKDLQAQHGDATDPELLQSVEIHDMDIVISLTESNQTNLAASKLCSLLSPGVVTIARVSHEKLLDERLMSPEGFDITHAFNPEHVIAENICNIINNPGCLSIDRFANGRVTLTCLKITSEAAHVAYNVKQLHDEITDFPFYIVAIYRDGNYLEQIDSQTYVYVEDEIYIIIQSEDLSKSIACFVGKQKQNHNIIIAGGTDIALAVAKALEQKHNVKVIEPNVQRCSEMAQVLNKTLVLKSIPTDEFLLKSEGIEQTDIFCALTKQDAQNLLSTMLARRLGAKRTMVIVNHDAYVDILEDNYGVIISPSQITVNTVLEHVRLGTINSVHSLRHGNAEAFEATIQGDEKSSKLIGKEVGEIKWPQGLFLGIFIRDDKPLFIHNNLVIKDQDRIICFITKNSAIGKMEKMLLVDFKYF